MTIQHFDHTNFSDADLRARQSSVAVLIPAHNEGTTITNVVAPCVAMRDANLIDEVIVIADRCTDDTEKLARNAGAQVFASGTLFSHLGPVKGKNKGDVLWRGIHAAVTSDITVMVDGDSGREFGAHFIRGLAGPLVTNQARFVKATYERPLATQAGPAIQRRRGRVNSLCAFPLLFQLWPELSEFEQILAGEMSAFTKDLRRLSLPTSYGVEVGMAIGLLQLLGNNALMAECDLGRRQNRHQGDAALEQMALAITQTILALTPPDRLARVAKPEMRPGF